MVNKENLSWCNPPSMTTSCRIACHLLYNVQWLTRASNIGTSEGLNWLELNVQINVQSLTRKSSIEWNHKLCRPLLLVADDVIPWSMSSSCQPTMTNKDVQYWNIWRASKKFESNFPISLQRLTGKTVSAAAHHQWWQHTVELVCIQNCPVYATGE